MSSSALSLRGVSRQFGATRAVDELSFEISEGEMFGLIGPDGAGKTTTIRLACGLLRPHGGEIRVLGRDPVREHRAVAAEVGYLSQRFSLYGDLTVDENIAFFAEIHGVAGYRAVRDRLLDLTRLAAFRSRRADLLSGGMKQKLALACTLVHAPKLLLLDEPTTGVDPVSRREFWKLLSEFLAQGLTIVMATPYLDEAERCSRVALLHEGRLLALDPPGELQRRMGQVLEVSVGARRPPVDVLAAVPGVRDVQPFGDRAHVRLEGTSLEDGSRAIEAALATGQGGAVSVRPVDARLEDVFIDLIGTARESRSSPRRAV